MGLSRRALSSAGRKPSVADVEVEIEGQRVINGSTVSTSGTMRVTTSENYALFVDGVAWVPTTTEDNTDVYIIASGGRFVFYDERGNVMFAFYNQYTADFAFLGYNRVYLVSQAGSDLDARYANRTYVQVNTYLSNTASFRIQLEGDYTNSPATELEPTTSNGDVGEIDVSTTRLIFSVTNFDTEKAIVVKLGNVLCAYIAARS